MAAMVGGVLVGTVGFLVGSSGDPAAKELAPADSIASPPQRFQWLVPGARKAAQGDLDDLVASYGVFIMVVEECGDDDDALWEGIDRLGGYALSDRGDRGVRIAKRIVAALGDKDVPGNFRRLFLELEEMLLQSRNRNR